ncbi:hypothetical protein [Streptomyces sp. NPDC001903]
MTDGHPDQEFGFEGPVVIPDEETAGLRAVADPPVLLARPSAPSGTDTA